MSVTSPDTAAARPTMREQWCRVLASLMCVSLDAVGCGDPEAALFVGQNLSTSDATLDSSTTGQGRGDGSASNRVDSSTDGANQEVTHTEPSSTGGTSRDAATSSTGVGVAPLGGTGPSSEGESATGEAWGDSAPSNSLGELDTADGFEETDTLTSDPEVTLGLLERPPNPTCLAPERPSRGFVEVFTDLDPPSYPMMLVQPPDDDSHWYVVQRDGEIHRFENEPDVAETTVFGSIADRVSDFRSLRDDSGLYALAFHPEFPAVGQIFLLYTSDASDASHPRDLEVRVARYDATWETFDSDSEVILLRHLRTGGFELGGGLEFGPDGMLYASFGSGDDEQAQRLDQWPGKIVRIDVDHTSHGQNYAIPPDNPFVGMTQPGVLEEVFALGFRNPWRMSFDRDTAELWVGDVGSRGTRDRQEIDRVIPGGNYGWPDQEGDVCYSPSGCDAFIPPVYSHDNTVGRTIVMGVVYRGSEVPELVGTPIVGDTLGGFIWTLVPDDQGSTFTRLELDSGHNVTHFAQDLFNEVYLTSYVGDRARFYRLIASPADGATDAFPVRLSETGCVDPDDPTRPVAAMIPYAVQSPLWSDGAEKQRWFALPDETSISITPSGDLDFPVGSVLMKEFRIGSTRLETRLLVHHFDGTWAGYTYAWNEAETDAELLLRSFVRPLSGGFEWTFPSRAACMECHTESAGWSLGLELRQLNGSSTYPSGVVANQLDTLEAIGVFATPLTVAERAESLPNDTDSDASIRARARSYLHSNCSGCHNPASLVRPRIDLRATIAEQDMGICNVEPIEGDLAIPNARIVVPGAPDRSILYARISRRGEDQMPPIGTALVDDTGANLLRTWILEEACLGLGGPIYGDEAQEN